MDGASPFLNPPYPLLILQGKPRNQFLYISPLQHFLKISHSVSIKCFHVEGSGLQTVTPYDSFHLYAFSISLSSTSSNYSIIITLVKSAC